MVCCGGVRRSESGHGREVAQGVFGVLLVPVLLPVSLAPSKLVLPSVEAFHVPRFWLTLVQQVCAAERLTRFHLETHN